MLYIFLFQTVTIYSALFIPLKITLFGIFVCNHFTFGLGRPAYTQMLALLQSHRVNIGWFYTSKTCEKSGHTSSFKKTLEIVLTRQSKTNYKTWMIEIDTIVITY